MQACVYRVTVCGELISPVDVAQELQKVMRARGDDLVITEVYAKK